MFADEVAMIGNGKRHSRQYILDAVYVVVRICPIVFLASIVVLAEKTTSEVARHLITVTNIIIMPAASGLFFIRLSAVYSHSKYIMIPFGFCWLGVLGIFAYISIEGMARCSGVNRSTECFEVQPIDAWGYIATAIYDTFMYLAISWQLASFAAVDRWQDRLKSFVTGDGLGWLSKVLLQSGQVYYFITIGFTICTTIFIYSPSVPTEWNALFVPVNATVTSIMTCRLFRELKLDLLFNPMADGVISKVVNRDIGSIPQQQSEHVFALYPIDEGDVDIGTETTRGVSGNNIYSGQDIELEEREPRTCD
ncbi:hypothetical protein PILCRDRAFT_755055 [Piloderma croceum F 1598]|uniref:Uncharacterized protein n=1 Tax=Piloderma croceum (strain F 1598) TaxID=765440 RepID=A0A0C3ETI9_PILCF|nr:hypothetical protein PILCRDRAFT_755055 [Piloderma croceum F 1598]